jgi:HK97 family phage portal protein
MARNVVGRPMAPMVRFDQFAKEGFTRNVVAYRCIEEIGKGVASVPLVLFAGEKEADQNHEVLQRLKRPNPMQSWYTFVSHVIGYFLIAGNTYLEQVAPVGSPPRELYALRPDRMTVIPGSRGFPQAYAYAVGTDKTLFDVHPVTGHSDVRHIKTFHPLDDWYGMSPIQAAATPINQFNESGEWNTNLILRGASRSGGLELQAQDGHYRVLDDIQYAKITKRLDEQYSGPRNAGRAKLFEGGLKWVDMSFSPQDMDWINGKHTSARDICSAFGFPCQLLGIPGDNTYSNYKEARQALYENTVMPLVYLLLGELNVWYTPRFSEGLEIRPDEDRVLALAPRREALWERVQKATHISENEKRNATGYEPYTPTGDPADDLYQSATLLPLGFDAGDSGAEDDTGKERFVEELKQAGVTSSTIIAELVARAFPSNGEWRDDA